MSTLSGMSGRPLIHTRISPEGLAAIDANASREGVDRSGMVRLMLLYASEHMPPGWRPNQGRAQTGGAG